MQAIIIAIPYSYKVLAGQREKLYLLIQFQCTCSVVITSFFWSMYLCMTPCMRYDHDTYIQPAS